MFFKTLIVPGLLLSTHLSYAQELTLPENTTFRDYPKRDRLLIGGVKAIAPSQLHESVGLRVKISEEYQRTVREIEGDDITINTPQTSADLSYGWNNLTIGLGLKYADSEIDSSGETGFKEDFINRELLTQIAYTFGENITVGAALDHNWLDVKESGDTSNKFEYQYNRIIGSISYHTPKLEFGISHSGAVQESSQLDEGTRVATLSLAANSNVDRRDIYLPAMTTVFGRGNFTDNFSMLSSISYANYDDNVRGSVFAFEDADTADLLAAKITGVYWTTARSHVSLAAEYKGGATVNNFDDETLLGYRLGNTLGATLEGVYSIDRKIYLGGLISYLQGETDIDLEDNTSISVDENTTRVGGFVAVKI